MAPVDPHSYTDSLQPLTTHVALSLSLDFQSRSISGTATLTLTRPYKGQLFLDTRDLCVHQVVDSEGRSLSFSLDLEDSILGSRLVIDLPVETGWIVVSYSTSPHASALQWLEPSQTAGGNQPYVFTQCQAIHARSVFPCQDTPVARVKYTADVEVPSDTRVVMSAAPLERVPLDNGRAVERFVMNQAIPPYLFALAAGDIVHEEIGPRTRVYAEPSVVKAAAYEFANTEATITHAEALFGPYEWERFDVLVMPPSFPYGGMENPRMVFLTPTLIVGDRSAVEVVAHELAHSWTGNLISNATANDFWLNEGFTTYAERRIVEAEQGKDRVELQIGLGWSGLKEEVGRFKDKPQFTKLKMDLKGVDPDEIYSRVPYEKGFHFLRRLESQVGRPKFDKFLKEYIAEFQFQSIDTETFLAFLKERIPGIGDEVDLDKWIYGEGIPADALEPRSEILDKILELAAQFESGRQLMDADTQNWQAQEWIVYLDNLPKKLSSKQISMLDDPFHFSRSKNWEIRVTFLTIAAHSDYKPCFPAIEDALHSVGRIKYLRPLYAGLLDSSPEAKQLAKRVFSDAKPKYHPIAQSVVQRLLTQAGL
jgi:leukotriene-A4 hydrolase